MKKLLIILGSVAILTLSITLLAGGNVIKIAVLHTPLTRMTVEIPELSQRLSGSWQGSLVAPGISAFEVYNSTITFQSESTFELVIDKSTGSFRRSGTYRLNDGVLTLDFGGGPAQKYKLVRISDTLRLSPMDSKTSSVMTLTRM